MYIFEPIHIPGLNAPPDTNGLPACEHPGCPLDQCLLGHTRNLPYHKPVEICANLRGKVPTMGAYHAWIKFCDAKEQATPAAAGTAAAAAVATPQQPRPSAQALAPEPLPAPIGGGTGGNGGAAEPNPPAPAAPAPAVSTPGSTAAAATVDPSGGGGGGGADAGLGIKEWLLGINPALAVYDQVLIDEGYDDTSLLPDKGDTECHDEIFQALDAAESPIKKGHWRKLHQALLARE